MGIFSSSYQTSVATSVSRVITDALLPSAVNTGVITALMSGEDLVDQVLENLTNCIGVKAERLYKYGDTTYPYGLPSGQMVSPVKDQEIVLGAAALEANKEIRHDYYQFGALNLLHMGWMKLQQDYGYNSETNQLTTLSASLDTPAYLHDMVVVVTDASQQELGNGSLATWGVAPNAGATPYRAALPGLRKASPYEVHAEAAGDFVRVTYAHLQGESLQYSSMDLPITGFDITADYFQVGYSYDQVVTYPVSPEVPVYSGGRRGYFLYRAGSGVYPSIDAIFGTDTPQLGSFFPIGYLRYNKVAPPTDTSTAEYKAAKKYFRLLGLNYATIVDGISTNPEVANVEQAMLMMAIPVNTTDQLELRYLYDFFKEAYIEAGGVTPSSLGNEKVLAIRTLLNRPSAGGSFLIQDTRFKMTLSFDSISHITKAGTIGVPGTFASNYTTRTLYEQYLYRENELEEMRTRANVLSDHTFRRQVMGGLVDELRVTGLRLSYHIQGSYRVVASGTDTRLLIPVDRAITQFYSVPDKETLYARSLHYVINSLVETEIAWYASGWFQDLLMIVAIVATIWSLGEAYPLLAAAAALGMTSLALAVLVLVIKAVIVQAMFKLFVKAVGPEFAIIVAIAAAMAGMYRGYQAGSLTGAPFAKDLLMLSSGLSTGASAVTADLVSGITAEYGQLTDLYGVKSKMLETSQALLDTKNNLLSPFVIFGESPTDYYQRSVHQGNIGVAGISLVTSYVDIALTLPKLSETTGDVFNV